MIASPAHETSLVPDRAGQEYVFQRKAGEGKYAGRGGFDGCEPGRQLVTVKWNALLVPLGVVTVTV